MNNFYQRSLTGILYVGLIVACVWHPLCLGAMMLLISALCLWEFSRLLELNKLWFLPLSIAAVAAELVLRYYYPYMGLGLAVSIVFFIFFLPELYDREKGSFLRACMAGGALLYVLLPVTLFFETARQYYLSGWVPLGIFILIWANDTFAYLAGKAFGKTPLFPRISPKKTWEGFAGGLVGCIGISFLLPVEIVQFPQNGHLMWAGIAVVVVVMGNLGDLVQSMMKRGLNIKDSGNILPGHGGALDRFDSFLFAAPFVWLLSRLVLIVDLF